MPIRVLGDPVLRVATQPVTSFDGRLRRIADDMFETMYAAPGVGLAANQVGMASACFVYDDGDGHRGFVANPVLDALEGEQLLEEGCLSIPGPFHETPRAVSLRLRGRDLDGAAIEITAEGFLARIFQHETDHLNGRLYIDRLDDAGRREVLRRLREADLRRGEPT